MRKTSLGPTSKVPQHWSLVVFSVGGRRVAAKTEEVGGVFPWTDAMPVPSETDGVKAVARHGEEVLPVYDLAGRLHVRAKGTAFLCLVAKRRDGRMAICIDEEIPTIRTLDAAAVRPAGGDSDVVGTCLLEMEEVPIYSLATLGLLSTRPDSIGPTGRRQGAEFRTSHAEDSGG